VTVDGRAYDALAHKLSGVTCIYGERGDTSLIINFARDDSSIAGENIKAIIASLTIVKWGNARRWGPHCHCSRHHRCSPRRYVALSHR